MVCRNLSKSDLKRLKVVIQVNCGGKIFHNFAAFIAKLSSNLVKMLPFSLGSGWITALTAFVLGCNLKFMLMVFGFMF